VHRIDFARFEHIDREILNFEVLFIKKISENMHEDGHVGYHVRKDLEQVGPS